MFSQTIYDIYFWLADASGSYNHVPLGMTWAIQFKLDSVEVRKIRKHYQWHTEIALMQRFVFEV